MSYIRLNYRSFYKVGLALLLMVSSQQVVYSEEAEDAANPIVVLKTNVGEIHMELDRKNAPISTENFVNYVNSGFYNDTIFHRVIPGFMVQGGGMNADMTQKKTEAPIKNEAKNGLKNKRGSVAMARTAVVDSATAQFFINLKDNTFLDHGSQGFGYAVFGSIVKGMDIVDDIAKVKTGINKGHRDVPVNTVILQSASVK